MTCLVWFHLVFVLRHAASSELNNEKGTAIAHGRAAVQGNVVHEMFAAFDPKPRR